MDAGSPYTSELEAVNNAGFGKYNYDPATRLSMQQPNPVYLPGWQGYSTSSNPTFNNTYGYNYYNPYMNNLNVGLGANPYIYNNMGGNPYIYNSNMGNPAFSMGYIQPQQPRSLTMHIPAYNPGGEYMPLVGFQDKIDDLQKEFWIKEQEQSAKSNFNNYNNYGYNYYGNPYYSGNYYGMNSLRNEANTIINQMQSEARENRRQFNIRMSKLAHNISTNGRGYNEDAIEELYTGKDIENPFGITAPDLIAQNRFANLVPFDNSQIYRNHSLAASAQYSAIIRPDANLKECFDNTGIIGAEYILEEEAHRRRDCSNMYDSSDSGYRYFVKKKAAERYAAQNGIQQPSIHRSFNLNTPGGNNDINLARSNLTQFPLLSSAATLSDDGTLNIECNFGSRKGQIYSVNQNEAKYDQDRERFNQFLDSIPKAIYPSSTSGGGQ